MKSNYSPILLHLLRAALCVLAMPCLATAQSSEKASYLYNLSDFTGVLPLTSVRVEPDSVRDEIYVCNGGLIHIFNASGMEIYRFGEDEQLGYVYDIAVLEDGNLLLLSHHWEGYRTELILCDFRGEVLKRSPVAGMPEGWHAFQPSRMVLRGEKLYVVDLSGMKVAVLDRNGSFREAIDLAQMLKMDQRQVADSGMNGFYVDDQGNIYFTIPTKFTVYRISSQGLIELFGRPGGTPGKFGIIAGITADQSGTIYVVDTLKCVVSVFDKNFDFLYQFGGRTSAPGGLVSPMDITISGSGRLYVTQMGNRGVSMYAIRSN